MNNTIITKTETSLNLKGMTLEELKSSVDRIATDFQSYEAESYGIILAESEPLDHPDLDAIIDYIASKGITVSMLTRGAKLTADRIVAWEGKVSGIGIFENLKVFCEDADFDGFYPDKHGIPAELATLAEAASKARIDFIVSDGTRARLIDKRKENEQDLFYEIKSLYRGLIERSAEGSIARWEDDNVIKAELFPHENSEGYEIVTKTCAGGGRVTVRRTAEITPEEARFLIEIGEYDSLITIEASSEEEAKKIFCEKYLGDTRFEDYELSIEVKTLDDMLKIEADKIDAMLEALGKKALGKRSEALSRKRIRYEGMKQMLKKYRGDVK